MGDSGQGGLLEARYLMPVPTPQEQVEFLRTLQRLLTEGQFVASYKFALLRALADLAVLQGDDSGDELRLEVRDLAAGFVELYWRQARPFHTSDSKGPVLLRQNTGQQASVVRSIAAVHAWSNGSIARFRQNASDWDGLISSVAGVVAEMPLWKLQRLGDEVVDFLYPNAGRGRTITLRPGVAYCFRAYYGIVRNLVEGAWLNYVRGLNRDLLGESADVAAFLFGADRASLEVYRPFLCDLQSNRCFYCGRALQQTGEVDHFVPWARYPIDLGHNFVLAHRTCNNEKSDYIAAEEHLEAWANRNEQHDAALVQFFNDARLSHERHRSLSITRWVYSQTAATNGLTWVERGVLRHLGHDWQRVLRVG
jgi:hypothetical protein